jgi:FHS family L-fucose permease-like MFS transporter
MVAIYWTGGMVGRFFGAVMLSLLANAKRYFISFLVLVFSFFIGWFIFSSGFITGEFVFTSSPKEGLIFFAISVVNLMAMVAGQGNPNKTLGIFGIVAAVLVMAALVSPASVGMWTLLAVGFFNSIMFPTIFSLSVRDLEVSQMPMASGIINTLIVGGAVIPMCMGWFTDHISVRTAFLLPVICYSYIAFFALKGSKIR